MSRWPKEPDHGVSEWPWAALKAQVTQRGRVVLQDVRGADLRHAVAKQAAIHGLMVEADGPAAIILTLGK